MGYDENAEKKTGDKTRRDSLFQWPVRKEAKESEKERWGARGTEII